MLSIKIKKIMKIVLRVLVTLLPATLFFVRCEKESEPMLTIHDNNFLNALKCEWNYIENLNVYYNTIPGRQWTEPLTYLPAGLPADTKIKVKEGRQ